VSAEIKAWIVVTPIWIFQLVLFVWAIRISRRASPRLADDLEARCRLDVETRAAQGTFPDWLRYVSESDRLFEPRADRLRLIASSVLALGLLGTLAALLTTLFAFQGVELNPPHPVSMEKLVLGTVRSLGGSCLGVALHLVIVLILLRGAEDRFLAWEGGFETRLQEHAGRFPPSPPFLPLLKDELAEIRRSLGGEVAGALAKAVTGFPEVVRKLDGNLERLSVVLETRDASLVQAVQLLSNNWAAVSSMSDALAPIAAHLVEALSRIAGVPAALGEALDAARAGWLADLRAAQEERLREIADTAGRVEEATAARERQMLAEVRLLEAAVGEVRDAAGRIAGDLAAKIAELAGRLGTEFGREARDATLEMTARLEVQHGRLLDRLDVRDQEARNAIGTEVDELFQRVRKHLDDDLFRHLEGLASGLATSADALSPLGGELRAAQGELAARQAETLAGWSAVAREVAASAHDLVEADHPMRSASQALADSATYLRRLVADLASEAERSARRGAARDRLLERHVDVLRALVHMLAADGVEAA